MRQKKVKVLLTEGLTDSLAWASNAIELLQKKGVEYSLAVNQVYLERNAIDVDFMQKELGLNITHDSMLEGDWRDTHAVINLGDCQGIEDVCLKSEREIVVDTSECKGIYKLIGKSGKESFDSYHQALQASLNRGRLATSFRFPLKGRHLFLHYRIGDIALINESVISKIFGQFNSRSDHWVNPVHGVMSFDEIMLLSATPGMKGTAVILERIIPHTIYEKYLLENKNLFKSIHFSSDGFTRAAKKIKRIYSIEMAESTIEAELEEFFLGKIKSMCTSFSIGESIKKTKETLRACAISTYWQAGGSLYPFDFFKKLCKERPFYAPALIHSKNRLEEQFSTS